jgi:hypothetical protein
MRIAGANLRGRAARSSHIEVVRCQVRLRRDDRSCEIETGGKRDKRKQRKIRRTRRRARCDAQRDREELN